MSSFRRAALSLSIALASTLPFVGHSEPACAEEGPAKAPAESGGNDLLVLADGRRLEGSVVAETPEGVTFRAGGTTRFYAADQVTKTERGVAAAPVPAADAPRGDAAPGGKPAAPKEKRPKALTDESRQWVRDLAARAATQDEIVRRSIAAALRACGPAAAPTILEVAAAQSDAGTKSFLESIAADLTSKGGRKDMPPPGADADPNAPMPPPGDKPRPAAPRPVGKGGLFDRLAQELELRDDQRVPFMGVLSGIEKSRGTAFRELESGGTLESARGKLTDAKKAVLDGARGILDAGQMEAFEQVADRHFMEMENKLVRQAAKRAPAPERAPEK